MSHNPILDRWQCAEMERISERLSQILVADSVEEEMGGLFHHFHMVERTAREVAKDGDLEELRKVLENWTDIRPRTPRLLGLPPCKNDYQICKSIF